MAIPIISIFKNSFSHEKKDVRTDIILKGIVNGKWKHQIEHLRKLSKEDYDNEKRNLPAVTFAGTFSERKDTGIIEHSGLIVIDIDKIDENEIYRIKKSIVENDKYALAGFVSPSGKGIKIIFQHDGGINGHKAAFFQIKKHIEELHNVFVDVSGKNISRLCYVSWDTEMVFLPNANVMHVNMAFDEINKDSYLPIENYKNISAISNIDDVYSVCGKWVKRNYSYTEGTRNVYIHALACIMNRCGIELDNAIFLLCRDYDLGEKEIERTVKSAYFHNTHEFATVEVKNIEGNKVPANIPNFNDDIVVNEIQQMAVMLHDKIDRKSFIRLIKRYIQSFVNDKMIDTSKFNLKEEINNAIEKFQNQKNQSNINETLEALTTSSIMEKLISGVSVSRTGLMIPEIDSVMKGGGPVGNFYGLVGPPRTFKSVFAMHCASENAKNNTPILYLNGEMSEMQLLRRLIQKELSIDIEEEIRFNRMTEKNIRSYIKSLDEIHKRNFFMYTGSGFSEKQILNTIDTINQKTGKDVGMVVVDGITQMLWQNKEEISSTIMNAETCKRIAKKANNDSGTLVLGLLHISTIRDKHYRDMLKYARGGNKVVAQMDGAFSFSLCVDPITNEIPNDDVVYLDNLFYLRFEDKREGLGIHDFILENKALNVHYRPCRPSDYELKINKPK
jgi:archaellum biogenesis ATPase FlaH